jgi:hypothetical protein
VRDNYDAETFTMVNVSVKGWTHGAYDKHFKDENCGEENQY